MAGEEVVIYTDGSCEGNPGRGGYAAIMAYADEKKELVGGFELTTNNRMELLAVIVALEALKRGCSVVVKSDSAYVVNAVRQEWVYKWRAAGWRRGKGGKGRVLNKDLWLKLLEQLKRHKVVFEWVKGHSGVFENERCDTLAKEYIQTGKLEIDEGYDSEHK